MFIFLGLYVFLSFGFVIDRSLCCLCVCYIRFIRFIVCFFDWVFLSVLWFVVIFKVNMLKLNMLDFVEVLFICVSFGVK